jgi:uncharacterized protein
MKLYSGKIPTIATQLVKELVAQKMIDVDLESVPEVELDISSVLKEYVRIDHEVSDRTKDVMERRGLSQELFSRTKREVAKERGFPIDDPLAYVLDQIIETLLHSQNVEEIYGEDHDLRRVMKPVFQKHLAADEELDKEVRNRIKNLQEGTASWDIEYQRALAQLKRQKGFE